MAESITQQFGRELANLLSSKLTTPYPSFSTHSFVEDVTTQVVGKTYTQRVEIIADLLYTYLPSDYLASVDILRQILGPENPQETGMFTNYYWLLPVGKYVEKYGLDHLDVSLNIIGEITKRNTGEYAIRPYIRRYPAEVLVQMTTWSPSDNFHLRRLASEGLRPKLPWAPKLDTFIDDPTPVFAILENLKADEVKFVQKSVANHLTDYLKVNPEPARELIARWRTSDNPHTQWIIKHATRKIS